MKLIFLHPKKICKIIIIEAQTERLEQELKELFRYGLLVLSTHTHTHTGHSIDR